MTMGNSWSYVPGDNYKPATTLIHLLVDIVAKGGNFLLNIGPDPKGNLPAESLLLKEIAAWIKVNSGVIYKTRPVAPYKEGKICYTRSSGGAINAIYLAELKQRPRVPSSIWLQSIAPRPGSTVRMFGVQNPLKWEKNGKGAILHVPPEVCKKPPCKYAWAFTIERPQP